MVKIKILKIDYINECPDDEYYTPIPTIEVELSDKSLVKLQTPNLNRTQGLIEGGFFKKGKTIDVPIKSLPDGRIFIEEEFEIKTSEKLDRKSIKKSKATFDKLGIKYVGR